MKEWTYSIAEGTAPLSVDPPAFRKCIKKAIARVVKASGGAVRFTESQGFGARHVTFGFAELPNETWAESKMTVTKPDGEKIHTIAFDPGSRWAISGFQRLFAGGTGRLDLLAYAMHGIGHLLGLPHSDDEFSAMHTPTKVAEFNERDKMYLRYGR